MRLEFELEGMDVQFVSINSIDALDDQQKLVDRCSFPLLQDTDEAGVWTLHSGTKDDMYIYDADGNLAVVLPSGGELSITLSTDEGYNNVKGAIEDLL